MLLCQRCALGSPLVTLKWKGHMCDGNGHVMASFHGGGTLLQ